MKEKSKEEKKDEADTLGKTGEDEDRGEDDRIEETAQTKPETGEEKTLNPYLDWKSYA